MEYIDFKRLIDALTAKPKETEWLEFKHNFHSKEEIGERISALSNSAYLSNMPFGYIVFGIDDESHNVIGTDLYGKQKMVGNEELESWLSTRLNPRIDFEIIDDFDYEANGHVCIFKIPATTNRPVSFLHESYIRVGTITRKLKDFPAKEAKIWKGGQKPLEKIVLKKGLSGQDVFSFLSAEVYFDMMNLPLPQDINGILDRFLSENLITKDEIGYGITELGAILFAKRLSDFDGLKRKMVRVIVYKGKGKVETIREQSFDKGYAICFEEMIAWINSQLPPVRLQLQETRTETTVFSYRKFADLDKTERIMACYQHACLRYVSNEKMNNQSLRGRLGIEDKNYPMASRIIKDTLEAKLIKEEHSEGNSRHNYIPYWA